MKKVFYIEKKKFLREMFDELCRSTGISGHSVESPLDIEYLIEDLRPHLILIDELTLNMRENSFLSFLNKNYPEIPIHYTIEEKAQAKENMGQYSEKPLSISKFENIFRNILK